MAGHFCILSWKDVKKYRFLHELPARNYNLKIPRPCWWVMGACAQLRTGWKLRKEQNKRFSAQLHQPVNHLVSCALEVQGIRGPAVGEQAPVSPRQSQVGPGAGHSSGTWSELVRG